MTGEDTTAVGSKGEKLAETARTGELGPEIADLFEPQPGEALDTYLKLLHASDIAHLFDFVDERHWQEIARRLDAETLAEVFANLDERQIEILGAKLKVDRLAAAVEELETDDAADVLAELPDEKSQAILSGLEFEERAELESLLAYPEDSAGGLMQTELCRVRHDQAVADAIEEVRQIRDELDDVLEIFVVDDSGVLVGVVALEDLVLSTPEVAISAILRPFEYLITPEVDQEEVAQIFIKYNLVSLPVVDSTGGLLGRITFDDVHDVIEAEATEDMMAMAGSSNEELVYGSDFTRIAVFRLPWLISSLLGSLLTTVVVPAFSRVPGDTIVLASFVPVVMAMTGNVGSQTAMIVTRGIAIGKVELSAARPTLVREIAVGLLMGLSAGAIVGIFAILKNDTPILGLTLTLSMLSSMTMAAAVGALAPVLFKRMGIDPAIAAGPLVTTLCDLLGVSVYLVAAIAVLA